MAETEAIEAGTKLIDAWGHLSNAALFGMTALGLSIVIAVVVWIIFKYKIQKDVEDNKNARAKQYSDNLSKLQDHIDRSCNKTEDVIRSKDDKMLSVLKDINENLIEMRKDMNAINLLHSDDKESITFIVNKLNEMEKGISYIADNTSGIINVNDSMYISKIYFYKVIFNECDKVAKKSLKENDFVNRSEFVSNKFRTDIGEILSESRSNLCSLPLSINAYKLFKIDSTSVSERFMLVDMIWDGIKELYNKSITIDEKYEEVSLRILNIIRDYITEIMNTEMGSGQYKKMNSDFH